MIRGRRYGPRHISNVDQKHSRSWGFPHSQGSKMSPPTTLDLFNPVNGLQWVGDSPPHLPLT